MTLSIAAGAAHLSIANGFGRSDRQSRILFVLVFDRQEMVGVGNIRVPVSLRIA